MDETKTEPETAFDPSRRLCPDGACVGLIGGDGRCTVCGSQAEGSAAVAREAEAADPEAADPGAAGAAGAGAGDGFDPARRLCDDGSCVGVLGPDGVCPVCGGKAI